MTPSPYSAGPGYNPYPVPPLKPKKLRLRALYVDPDCMRFDLFGLFEVDWLQCYENYPAQGSSRWRIDSGVLPPIVRRLDLYGCDCLLDFNDKFGGGYVPSYTFRTDQGIH